MIFFKRLFGSSETKNFREPEKSRKKTSIFDFIKLDLQQTPDDTFYKGETLINTAGNELTRYRKDLDYREAGLFNHVEVTLFDVGVMNVKFTAFNAKTININTLSKFIDELYMVLGPDDDHKTKFSAADLKDYRSTEFNMLFRRSWSTYSDRQFPIYIDRDDETLSLSIHGIKTREDN